MSGELKKQFACCSIAGKTISNEMNLKSNGFEQGLFGEIICQNVDGYMDFFNSLQSLTPNHCL